jgi:hypothetical protein
LGDNREKNNQNYDNAYTEIKLIGQEGAKFFAANLATKSSPREPTDGIIEENCGTIMFCRWRQLWSKI